MYMYEEFPYASLEIRILSSSCLKITFIETTWPSSICNVARGVCCLYVKINNYWVKKDHKNILLLIIKKLVTTLQEHKQESLKSYKIVLFYY